MQHKPFENIITCTDCGKRINDTSESSTCPICGRIYCYTCGFKHPLVQLNGKYTGRICHECHKSHPDKKVIDSNPLIG